MEQKSLESTDRDRSASLSIIDPQVQHRLDTRKQRLSQIRTARDFVRQSSIDISTVGTDASSGDERADISRNARARSLSQSGVFRPSLSSFIDKLRKTSDTAIGVLDPESEDEHIGPGTEPLATDLKKMVVNKDTQIAKLRRQIYDFKASEIAVKSENERLTTLLESGGQTDTIEMEVLRKQHNECKVEIQELRAKLSDASADRDIDGSENTSFEEILDENKIQAEEIIELDTLLTEALTEINQLRAEKSRSLASKEILDATLDEFEEEHKQHADTLAKLEEAKQTTEKRRVQMQEEVERLTDKLNSASLAHDLISENYSAVQNEMKALKRKFSDSTKLLNEVQSQHASMTVQLNDLRGAYSTVVEDNKELNHQIGQITNEQATDVADLTQELDVFRRLVDSAQQEIQILNDNIHLAGEDFAQQSAEYTTQLRDKNLEMKELHYEKEELDELLSSTTQKLKDALRSHQEDSVEFNTMGLEEAVDLAVQTISTKNAMNETAELLSEIDNLRSQLTSRNELLEKVMNHLQENNIDITDSIPDAATIFDDTASIQIKGSSSDSVLRDFDQIIEEESRKNSRLQEDLLMAKQKIKELEKEVEFYEQMNMQKTASHAPNPKQPKTDFVTSAAFTEGSYEKNDKSVVQDDRLSDLIKELELAVSDRESAKQLVNALVKEINQLKLHLQDLSEEDSGDTIRKLLNDISVIKAKYLELQKMYDSTRKTVGQFLALSARDEEIRKRQQAEIEKLRKELLKARSQIRELQLRLDDVPDYPELLAQYAAMENKYNAVKNRLEKMMEWTKVQALRSWVSDSKVYACPGCERMFGFMLRKHHCRVCGKVFCSMCSSRRIQTTASRRPARCCQTCYDYILGITLEGSESTEAKRFYIQLDRQAEESVGFTYSFKEDLEYGGKICSITGVESSSIALPQDEGLVLSVNDRVLDVNGTSVDLCSKEDLEDLFEQNSLHIFVERMIKKDRSEGSDIKSDWIEQMLLLDKKSHSANMNTMRQLQLQVADDSDSYSGHDSESSPSPTRRAKKINQAHDDTSSHHIELSSLKKSAFISEVQQTTKEESTTMEHVVAESSLKSPVNTQSATGVQSDKESILRKSITANDVGKRCSVDGYNCHGTVRFVGLHVTKDTLRIGVELDNDEGKNNGCIQGYQYFDCATNHGVLVHPKKVRLLPFSGVEDETDLVEIQSTL